MLADLAHVLARWRLPDVSRVERPELGTMNETWLIHHAKGGAVLRRHRSCDLEAVRFEHTVIEHVRSAELPVPALIPSRTGDTVVQQKGGLYTLYSLEPGEHPERGRAGMFRAHAAGETLGRVHSALASLDGGPDDTDGPEAAQATEQRFDELERATRSLEVRSLADWVLRDLEARREWLARRGTEFEDCEGPLQVIHGDYQLTNLLFVGDSVSSVIDWDRARRASPAAEIVRALDHGLELAPDDSRAFISGYRAVLPLSEDALNGAVAFWAQQQARSLWVLERTVEAHDVRAVAFLRPFRPFDERWLEASFDMTLSR